MSPGISTISLSQQSVGPVNISQSLMTPSTAAPSSSASPVSYSPSSGQSSSGFMGFDCSYPMEGAHKRIRMEPEERLVVDILDDNIMGRELKLGDHHQIVDLDSSKGRRWSNNSTTSTISSSFSLNTSEGGCVVSRPGDGTGRENLGILGHGYQQDKFCSPEELGAQKPKTGEPAYEMGTMEEEHYQMGGQMEGEFFINSDNYLTDEEKLKLRRRGRRRRPGEIEAWKTIIPRTTVDEAEHFVQTSQYRMRHVYRDPRAVSFVYRQETHSYFNHHRCVQHVECQYEMRIYLISHETCYVQHRGYHTEEKQKYKRPGLPQHTLPLIDELIRKGLPPKSVIDHAIQIYPEVADQSNISVLILVVLLLQGERVKSENFHAFSLEEEQEAGSQYVFDNFTEYNPDLELGSPFGMVPSGEYPQTDGSGGAIDLQMDESEEQSPQTAGEMSAYRLGGDPTGADDHSEDSLYAEDGDELGEDGPMQTARGQEEDSGGRPSNGSGSGSGSVGRRESDGGSGKDSGLGRTGLNIFRTSQSESESEEKVEGSIQERPKTTGTGLPGRTRGAVETKEEGDGKSEKKQENVSKDRETVAAAAAEGEGGARIVSTNVTEDLDKEDRVLETASLGRGSGEGKSPQGSANSTSGSQDIQTPTAGPILHANSSAVQVSVMVEGSEGTRDSNSTGRVSSVANATTETPTQVKSKPKSLKKASSAKGKRKSSRKEESVLKKASRETSKTGHSEAPRPGRLGSSRGDSPRPSEPSKTETVPRPEQDLWTLTSSKDEPVGSVQDSRSCLNLNGGILQSLGALGSVGQLCSLVPESRESADKQTESEAVKGQKGLSGGVQGLSSKLEVRKRRPSHPFWLEVARLADKLCAISESRGQLESSVKVPAGSLPSQNNSVQHNLTEPTTTAPAASRPPEVLVVSREEPSSAEKRPEARSLASTEREKAPEREPVARLPRDAGGRRTGGRSGGGEVRWETAFRMLELLSLLDSHIIGMVQWVLRLNTSVYGFYTSVVKRRVLRQAQGVLRYLPIVNKSEMNRNKHFLGAYTLFGSVFLGVLLMIVVDMHKWASGGKQDEVLGEAEALKRLGQVGGKIKMLSSHIGGSDGGVGRVVYSDDPGSICGMIREGRIPVSEGSGGLGSSEDVGTYSQVSLVDLTARLEENNEILLHLSDGLAKCARSLRI
ncbi:hypothetical protein OIY81_3534 [Cryptosporidium canis]|nr:hypothetical protein OIY81_3534 [Cryptosporidium canis]